MYCDTHYSLSFICTDLYRPVYFEAFAIVVAGIPRRDWISLALKYTKEFYEIPSSFFRGCKVG